MFHLVNSVHGREVKTLVRMLVTLPGRIPSFEYWLWVSISNFLIVLLVSS